MFFKKTIRNHNFVSLLKLHSPLNYLNNPLLSSLISSNSSHSSISLRPFSVSALFADAKIGNSTEPASVFFKKAVVAPDKSKNSGIKTVGNRENPKLKEKLKNSEESRSLKDKLKKLEEGFVSVKEKLRDSEEEVRSLKENLRNLEEEITRVNKRRPKNEKKSKPIEPKVNLWKLFTDTNKAKEVKAVEPSDEVHKELSSGMQMFARHLYVQGYFKNANFIPKDKFDMMCFELHYAREYLKFAAFNFGKDHQEIAKWLSAKDLEKVALFGCPSSGERSAFAAKHMRGFFKIDEQKVCQTCVLKESCKHANKGVKKASSKKLDLSSVTRVLTMYAIGSVPPKLLVPQEITDSVNRLLKEIVDHTANTS